MYNLQRRITFMKIIRAFIPLSLFLFIVAGCYIETDVFLTPQDELYLSNMIISIDSGGGPEIIESSIRHSLNVIGLRDAFDISKYAPPGSSTGDYIQLKPTHEIQIKKDSAYGDKISITSIEGGGKKLEWQFEPRTQDFSSRLDGSKPENLNKVFLIVRISFPGQVDIANTSENDGPVYTWRITNAQMTKPFKIQAIYTAQ